MIYKKYILVVDDNEVNRKILYRILSDTYNILQASNGKEALDVIEKYGENISLILLDLLMPVMDGYHFIERQQQIPLLKSIPVMITTQKDSDKDEIEALSKGAADFLTKPYNAALIKHRVANIIKLRETAAFVNVVEHDGLTGLYNKEAFYERVSQKLAHRDIKDEYDIICMDIENFKLVNDMFGEKEGDKLLCYVANAIKTTIKPVNGIAARITGDIFVILLPRIFGHEQEFVSAIQKQLPEYTSKFNVIIRFGVYQIIDEDIPVRAMCDRAKLASHTIKGIYDQYYIYYDDKLRNTLLDEQEITGLMQEALNQGQFTVYFQPKCCLESEKIIGAEALVRWHHPQKGFLSPADFIPLFEKNGFITTLDLYVLEKTCQELRKWIDAGYNVVPISVNISRVDIYNPQLPEIISDIVNKYNLDTKYLHIEITESAYTENAKQLIDMVTSMKARGFVVEMDDFGSGYSSLNMLSDVPVDTLKLDMRFLRGNNSKNKSEDILDFIVNLAERLKLSVIAEGIETQIDLNFLRSIGCEFGQGYYFSKPLPSEDFEKLIKNIDKTDIHISKKDISHNMKYEEYLHYYELRSLINHIPGGIFKCKADVCGKIEFASDNLFDIIGYTRQEFEELFDNVFENLIYEEDRERTLKEIEQQIVSSDFDYIEYRIKTKSGEIKWLYDVGHVVKDNEGVNWFYTIIVDITDLKKAQELVSFEKESFKFILPYIQDVIFEWCIKNNTLSCSENFKSKMGYSLPKSIEENGEFWVKTVSPDDIDNVRELISSLQNGTKFASCDVRLKNSDGEYVNFKLSSTSIIDNEGKTARIVGVLSEQH